MSKEWKVASTPDKKFLSEFKDLNPLILRLLYNRGIKKRQDIESFLNPDKNDLFDPFLYKDMEEAVDLIIKHIKNKSLIAIYGDYDADGVTASALLFECLGILRADLTVYIPGRVKEGYGLNKKAIDYLARKGVKLIITVDCSIRNKEEVEYAKEKGLEMIITDHHPAPEKKADLPDCLAIDALSPGEKYPFSFLAGVGVAFKLASAVISKSKLKEEQKDVLKNRLLDLVAIGTIADMVPLFSENRILAKEGLEVINRTRRKGLKFLIEVSGLKDKKINAWNVGFQLGPRINAAGRLDHVNTALELLIEKDSQKAKKLAEDLNKSNIKRQETTEEIIFEAEKQIKDDDKIIIAVCPENAKKRWNEGIVGLVAGRITEKYGKPSLVLTRNEEGFKGSGRSVEGFNLAQAIAEVSDLLTRHGGHPMACGLALETRNLEKFKKQIRKKSEPKLAKLKLTPKLKIDAELDFELINMDLVEKIKQLEPFGQANPEPIFVSRDLEVEEIFVMGAEKQHIKLRFAHIWAIAFGRAEQWREIKTGDKVELAYTLEINEFRGKKEVQMKIIDLKTKKKIKEV